MPEYTLPIVGFSFANLMALVLHQQVETTLPIEVSGITPDRLAGLSLADINRLPIHHGNQKLPLAELFQATGELAASDEPKAIPTPTIRWTGNLKPVHWIGAQMRSGRMEVMSSVGRHLGSGMAGGEIILQGDAADHVGCEMTGGTIRISGSAGSLVGANYPGSKYGMNRGQIFIGGDAGKGVGQRMRRGTIVVGGNCGKLAGWDMLAGTLIVLGDCGENAGANMSRGTIVLAGNSSEQPITVPTFRRCGTGSVPALRLLATWLAKVAPELNVSRLATERFTQFHGDALTGHRGELFIQAK